MQQWMWGIVALLVVGIGVIVYGWAHDRARTRRALDAETKPTRDIPGLSRQDAPAYVTERDLAGAAIDPSATSADADLIAHRDAAATLPAGAANGAFLNHPDQALAVLARPDVLVLSDDLAADRDVNTLLLAASQRHRPLVIVAPYFANPVLGTLRANLLKGTLRTLPIALEDAALLRRAVALTGGRLVTRDDLASGWLPTTSWGTCDGWVADLDDSWIVVTGRSDADPRPTPEKSQ